MNAEIVAVGTELLMGQIANTNAQYISQKLSETGIDVYFHDVVGDNENRIKETISYAMGRSDIIIVTGGLGPTQDDLTKETVAKLAELPLKMHEESKQNMLKHFENMRRHMVDSNLKQVMMPEGAVVIPNNNGTAPGCVINFKGKDIVLLPGPPKEMKPMFDWYVANHIKQDCIKTSRFIRIFGVGESAVENEIINMIDGQKNPTIATYIEDGTVIIRVTASAENKEESEKLLEPTVKEIINKFRENVYNTTGENLEQTLVSILKARNLKVAVAESCTGGMIASRLVNISGASEVFDCGVVSYSNEAKNKTLGVRKKILENFGAVSHETVKEMAEGIKRISNADIGISVSGIAGPEGGGPEKPVGLVYIGIAHKDGTESFEHRFDGNRDRIRLMSTMTALDLLRRTVLSK